MRRLASWLLGVSLLAVAGGQQQTSPISFPPPTALRAHQAGVNALAFSPDSHLLVTAGSDGNAYVWDTESGQKLYRLEHVYPVQSVAVNQLGTQALLGGGKSLTLWDLESGKQLQAWEEFSGSVASVAFQPTGDLLAVGNTNRSVELWDTKTGQKRELVAHSAAVRQVLFTLDGQQVISGSQDGQIKFWNAASGRVTRTLEVGGVVSSLALDRSGKRLAVGTIEGKVTVLGVASGQVQTTFEQSAGVNSVAFSLDENLLMVGTLDRKLALWNLAGARANQLTSLDNPASITGMAYSQDGRYVAVGRSTPNERQNAALYRVQDGRIAADNALPPAPANYNSRRLLVFGAAVEQFQGNEINPLNSTVDDIMGLGYFFERLAGSPLYHQVNTRLLMNKDATRARVLESLQDLVKVAAPNDLVLLFFSSHGVTVNGKYYFVPFDGTINAPEKSMISGSEIVTALKQIKGQVVLFLDTCHAGQAGKTKSVGVAQLKDTNPQQFIAQASQTLEGGRFIIVAAAGPNELANESGGNGLFSRALLEGLQGAARGHSGQAVAISQLLKYTQQRVPELVQTFGGVPQHPVVSGLSSSDNWPIAP